MKSPVALMGAMDCEIEAYLEAMTHVEEYSDRYFHFYTGTLEDWPIVLSKSGVGKVVSTMVAQALIERYHPAFLLFSGIAGAFNPDYQIGDVILADDLVQHDMDVRPLGFERGQIAYTDIRFIQSDRSLLALAEGCQLDGHRIHTGRILTGDQFIAHEEKAARAYLTEELKGDAVEMEGASVALACHLLGVPFLVVRTISDRADGAAPDDFHAFLPEASHNSFKVVSHILASSKE